MLKFNRSRRAGLVSALSALTLAFAALPAAADTLLMPPRDYLMNTSEVVWGVSTLPNGQPFVLDYGDGSQTTGNVVDRSYIAFNHTYTAQGTYTIQLCVGDVAISCAQLGAELTSVQVSVFNGPAMSPFALRGLNVNRAIQDGLRWLWTSQLDRAANFPSSNTTSWQSDNWSPCPSGFCVAATSLAVLAFENHGYHVPNNNSAPTGIFERFAVDRGLNYIASQLSVETLNVQNAGDPCVGVGTDCVGLANYTDGDPGYSTALAALPLAGSNALTRTFSGLPAGNNSGYPNGRTYGEVLQRTMNAIAWGQNDGPGCSGAGGWIYGFANNFCQSSDGSTVGWDVLALLDAGAAGTTIPGFVKTEFQNNALPNATNNDGSFDYQANSDPNYSDWSNIAKAGVGLQGNFYVGAGPGNFDDYIIANWATGGPAAACGFHLGCAYDMFNIFKGLKLHGVATLPGIGRPAGPGTIPADDWYAAYVDWLVGNQSAPTTTAGGNWPTMGFSCCLSDPTSVMRSSIGLLILSPVALIQPDPTLFATIGLAPTNAVNRPNTAHTVTATALSSTKSPVPGVTIDFEVISGPNVGKTGQGTTDANGQTTFTYTDTSVAPWPKIDQIQASIGPNGSNIVQKVWVLRCDANHSNSVTAADLTLIRNANGQAATSAYDPRDGNGDMTINVADVRYCQTRLVGPLP